MITWPTSLPLPSVTLSGSASNPVIRTEMETGLVRQRRRFLSDTESFSVQWLFTALEFAAFRSFFKNTLQAGTLSFDISLPVGESLVDVSCVFIGGTYDFTHVPVMNTRVSAKLETQAPQTPDENWLYIFDLTGGNPDSFESTFASLHVLIHQAFPEALTP